MGINGIKLKKLVDKNFKKYFLNTKNDNNTFITILAEIIKKKKLTGHVFLVYSDRFVNIGKWYKQLWNESLGKNGLGIHLISALGAVDQHSQLQMWLDGQTIFLPYFPKKEKLIKIKDKKIFTILFKKKSGIY